ncbi:acetoacetyl-CoA synthetase-like isoform X1 [Varroa destructor]|uniref:Acetoacetyl-CoA synthetase n=2 Tax=Varroa destructor TaxID=109461 RepID=A0A7M7K5Q3_VARDE|nr:acetoacetyl-CoA synthetase-like isoform X1 [Varroa destructor]
MGAIGLSVCGKLFGHIKLVRLISVMEASNATPVRSWQHLLLSRPNKKQDRFREHINNKFALNLGNYHELYRWSVDQYPLFWEEYLRFSDILVSSQYTQVIEDVPMEKIPRWFSGCRLNYAENLLRGPDDAVALYVTDEWLSIRKVTFSELRREVARYSAALRQLGVKQGDRVCGYVGNTDHAVTAYLATATVGAIWSSTSPDLGYHAVIQRFQQIKPKVIFAVDRQTYNKKIHEKLDSLRNILEPLDSVEKVIILPYDKTRLDISNIRNAIYLDELLAEVGDSSSLQFEQVEFSAPLCILFTSGTTGRPKCMVHSVGGTLIQHRKEHELLGELNEHDIFFYYTTTGWMMWNWLVSGLAAGAALVLYEGAPMPRDEPFVLFDIAARVRMTVFGTSAKYLAAVEELEIGGLIAKRFDLSTLHTVLATGSTLMPHSFDFVYNHIKEDVMLGSISGGSDIISCFVGQNCTLPVVRGEVQSRNLAMDIRAFDSSGSPVEGAKGELVCCSPFPSMPVFFWGDKNNRLYHKTYFEKFPNVWHHGDFCQINPATGGVLMLGRSDATLNPNGIRFGSSEVYNVVDTIVNVEDSVCVSYVSKKTKDEKVCLFVKMKSPHTLTEDIRKSISIAIRDGLSARHVPSLIAEVVDIPYTLNGKKIEVAVKKIINGDTRIDTSTIANPACLKCFEDLAPEIAALD